MAVQEPEARGSHGSAFRPSTLLFLNLEHMHHTRAFIRALSVCL